MQLKGHFPLPFTTQELFMGGIKKSAKNCVTILTRLLWQTSFSIL